MAAKPEKTSPTWSDVKREMADFDRAGLFGIIQDLYAASKANQIFLHARFGLGGDVLAPYKAIIDRWLWPDPSKIRILQLPQPRRRSRITGRLLGSPRDWRS
jgi:hypothetical protein